MIFSMLVVCISAEEETGTALPTDICGKTSFATRTAVSFDEEDVLSKYVKLASNGRCTYELVDAAVGKGLKMTSGSGTCELYVELPPDKNSKTQNWSFYDGIMWYVDNTGLTLKDGDTVSGTAVRAYPANTYAWTRNTATPVLADFAIDAYYLKDGTWTLCDQSKMNGERLMVPENFKGWMYVPFSSYITVKGSKGVPEQGIYTPEAMYQIMLLSGPYQTADGCSSLIFDEITLVKFDTTAAELAALIEANTPAEAPEEQNTTVEPVAYFMPEKILDATKYATRSVMNFDEENVLGQISEAGADRCTWELVDSAKGKGLKLTNKLNTGEVKIKLFGDEGNEDDAQDWRDYEGIMWWIDTTGVTYSTGKTYTGSAVRVYSAFGSGCSWTRNTTTPVIENFAINAYYIKDGEWVLCDQSLMNGERVIVPENYSGWVYVPFSSYITTQGSLGDPEPGIYANYAISNLTLLSGPYTVSPEGCSSIVFDEIMLIKTGVTNEELAAEIAARKEQESIDAAAAANTTVPTPADNTPATTTAEDAATAEPSDNGTTAVTDEASGGCSSSLVVSPAIAMLTVLGGGIVLRKKKYFKK